MSFREKKMLPTSPKSPLPRRRRLSWSGSWLNHPTTSFIQSQPPPNNVITIDRTLSLPDSLLLNILHKLPQSNDLSLVCKRWLSLHGQTVKTLTLHNFDFLLSGRLLSRFPKLTDLDLTNASVKQTRNSISRVHKSISFHTDSSDLALSVLDSEVVDRGLSLLGNGLRKLVVVNATELGLLCLTDLLELELIKCSDNVLRGIAACGSLRVLKLVGSVDGLYKGSVTDIGLTILAQGCKGLVKLELCGCEGSFDGVKAIGQCCEGIEELVVCDHRMDDGWIAALTSFEKLKVLRLTSCRKIDCSKGLDKVMGACLVLESLEVRRCCLKDKDGMRALFKVCEGVRKVEIRDCWGLDDESFSLAKALRRVRYLSLEGCGVLTTSGLESVILRWEELESMSVVSCKNIKDSEISAALSSLFSLLKELKWRPDTRSHLVSSFEGAGIGNRGSKFFKKR